MSVVASVKSHPYLAAAGAATALVIIFALRASSGGASTGTQVTGSDVTQGEAFQTAQLQANTAIAGAQIAAQSRSEEIAAGLQVAQLQAHTSDNANQLAAAIAMTQITSDAQNTALLTTLQADVANKNTAAQIERDRIASQTTIATTQSVANALISQSQIQADTIKSVTAKKCGWLGAVFGC